MNTTLIISLSVASTTSLMLIIVFINNIKLKKKNKILMSSLVKIQQMVEFAKKDDLDNDVHKENFIKFISDSRESAYEYIESVQNGLGTFINAVKPDIEYFNEYGGAAILGPDHDMMKRISIAYEELIKLMPEEETK